MSQNSSRRRGQVGQSSQQSEGSGESELHQRGQVGQNSSIQRDQVNQSSQQSEGSGETELQPSEGSALAYHGTLLGG